MKKVKAASIEDKESLTLSPEDSIKFVTALLNPPEPSPNLKKAYKRYKQQVIDDL